MTLGVRARWGKPANAPAEIAVFPLCARGAGEGMTSGVRPSAEGGGDAGEPGVRVGLDERGPVAGG